MNDVDLRLYSSRYPAIADLARALGKPFWIADLEATTGDVNDSQFGVVEIGFVRVDIDGSSFEDSFLIDAGFPMNPFVAKLTGISRSMYAGAPDFGARWPQIELHLRTCVVSGFGVHDLDCKALFREAERFFGDALEHFPITSLDVRSLWRLYSGSQKGRLSDVAKTFGHTDDAKHRALADARAAAQALEGLILAMGCQSAALSMRNHWNPLESLDPVAKTQEAATLILSAALHASKGAGSLEAGLLAMERSGATAHLSRKGLHWWLGSVPIKLDIAPNSPEALCAHFEIPVPDFLNEPNSLERCASALLASNGSLSDELTARASLCRTPSTASTARARLISHKLLPPWSGISESLKKICLTVSHGPKTEREFIEAIREAARARGVSSGHSELVACAASMRRERGFDTTLEHARGQGRRECAMP